MRPGLYFGVVYVVRQYGDTALHTAARYGHAGVACILINARATLNLQNAVSGPSVTRDVFFPAA